MNPYIEVLKPLPTLLLTFIGLCAAVVAGHPPPGNQPDGRRYTWIVAMNSQYPAWVE